MASNVRSSGSHKKMQLRTDKEKLLEDASPLQRATIKLLNFTAFDNTMGIVILFNMIVMIVETDRVASNDESTGTHWTEICGWVILVLFLVELGLRLFAFRCLFWKDAWNVFDFFVVLTDGTFSVLGLMIGNLFPISILRVLRLAKLARISKVLRVFPELRIMVAGLAGSVSAIFWGFVLLCLFVLVWSIVAVQFIHPWNKVLDHHDCPRCARAFASVIEAAMTIWQTVIAGDNWGQTAIPLMEAYPASAVFFVGVCVTVGMGVLNLILGVVCNVFTLAHDRIQQEMVLEERIAKLETQQHLQRICESLDETGSGELTQEQMRVGFDTHTDFHQVMDALEVSVDDLEIVWTIIDTEKSGAVSYQKFVDQVYLMKDNDTHFMLAYIKYYITKIKETLLMEIKSNHESTEKATEMQDRMMKQVEAGGSKVEQIMKTHVDKQVTDIVISEESVTENWSMDNVAAASARNSAESRELQRPPQSHHVQLDATSFSTLNIRRKTAKKYEEEDENSCGIAEQSSDDRGIQPDSSKGIVGDSHQLQKRLQNASAKIRNSLDKHICEVSVLIEEMMPEKTSLCL